MLMNFLICLLLFVIGYFVSATGGAVLIKHNSIEKYSFKADPFIYIFIYLLIATAGVFFFAPDVKDELSVQTFASIGLPFFFGAVIYTLYLLEMKKAFLSAIFIFSILSSFLLIDNASLSLTDFIAPAFEKGLIGILIALISYSALSLSGVAGVFSSFMSMALVGLIMLFYAGGMPLDVAFTASLWAGLWIAALQINNTHAKLLVNAGGMVVAIYIFCTLFLIKGINELSGPSVLILLSYPLCEFFWSLFQKYILRHQAPALYMTSVNFNVCEKGLTAEALHIAVIKICVLNVFMAAFQLFSSNMFTIPFLAGLIDFWLLSRLNTFDEPDFSIKEANQEFVQNVKNEVETIKKLSGKD